MSKLLPAILCTLIAPALWADPDSYNQNITAIFGAGNPSTGWTTDSGSGITLGLRAKNRVNGDTSNLNGVYTYATAPAPRGLWNYEFSILTTTGPLSSFDYYLAADRDPSAGTNFSVVQPLLQWIDNSFGTSSTASGAGVETSDPGVYAGYVNTYTLVQNSQNITFGDYPGGGLSLVSNATYDFSLYAVASGGGQTAPHLVDTKIKVIVGSGGASVPDSASTALLLGLGLSALAWLSRRRAIA